MNTTSLFTTIVLLGITYVIFTAYRARRVIRYLRNKGKPMPPFNWLTGHLLVIKHYLEMSPSDSVFNYTALFLARKYGKDHMVYLDFWPFNEPILVVTNAHAASQIMHLSAAQKPQTVHNAFDALTGGPNLLTLPEDQWKRWRSIFTPGFNPGHMLEQVPKIIERGHILCDTLQKHAKGHTLFQLEEETFKLTIDIISLVSLGSCFDYQIRDSRFCQTLRNLVEIVTFGQETSPLQRWNPIRPFLVWYYGRYLDSFIQAELDLRFSERKRQKFEHGNISQTKSIIDLALDSYMYELGKTEDVTVSGEFKRYAVSQLRLFLVAGHDTTSSAITYTLHMLSQNQTFLERVREEHDSVFGVDPTKAASLLSGDPKLLNQLPLTLAAIKETLRLFPPAGGIRMGSQEVVLTSEDGAEYPTANCAVWIVHEALHRNPEYWPDADSYLPDRWIVGPEDRLYPVKGAFRPFEIGPHSCIGQTLAMTEIKTMLVLVLRRYDISPAYDEWDASHPKKGLRTALGQRAYQVAGGGGGQHPADRYPCRVALRGEKISTD